MKFIARGKPASPRSPLHSPIQTPPIQTPPIQTPSPPITPLRIRAPFPKTLYLYSPDPKRSTAWTNLHPGYTICVYDVTQCEEFLLEEFGVLHRDIFRLIPDEDIQSKFVGVCILFAYGGFYSDIGNEPLVSLEQFIESDVDFVICNSYLSAINFNFNPSFIASHKDNPILKNCLDWYVRHYNANTPYSFLEWNMMRAFTEVLNLENYSSVDGIYRSGALKIQTLKECFDSKRHTIYCEYDKKRVINSSFVLG